ncbi:ABC transporter ATP-binding protein [Candidatus Clostridium stratigraminis]|uniref:ABC transporter ATP-binding protein n=1 Tax=Candidatus Clostridium stratigraminis TaxID=3381661 RepID=A0ABW8T3I5_9CLOT
MPELELINIEKTFQSNNKSSYKDAFTLSDINLKIEDGEFISLLGPSGCGKTTLLKIMTGLIKPDKGRVLEDNKDVTNMPVEKRNYAMVAQQPLLFPNMNLLDNICFGLKMKKINKLKRIAAAMDMINDLKLNGLEKRYPSELSGGQCQRGAIARALVVKPKVLFLDEAFNSLDEELKLELTSLIRAYHKNNCLTTILVTHDKDEANYLSDRIIKMTNL